MIQQITNGNPLVAVSDAVNGIGKEKKAAWPPEGRLNHQGNAFPEEPKPRKMEINMGDTSVAFDVDFKSKDVVIKVLDNNSGEVIKEIPPEVMRKVAAMLSEAAGKLFDKTV